MERRSTQRRRDRPGHLTARLLLAAALAGVAVAAGCGRSDEVTATTAVPAGQASATPPPSSTPPPSETSPPSSSAAADLARPGSPPGSVVPDGAPHHIENNAWRQRRDLAPEDRVAAEAAAGAVADALQGLREDGRFDVEAVESALVGLGHDAGRVAVRAMDGAPGAVYGVRVGRAGCVHGDVRPERVLVEVDGAHLEGCAEPSTGH